MRDYVLRAREKLGLIAPVAVGAGEGAVGTLAEEQRHARAFVKTGEPSHLIARAESLIAHGGYTRAIDLLLTAAALQGGAPLPYFHLAACHRRLGDTRQGARYARLYLRAVSASDPDAASRIRLARRWAVSPDR